MRNENLRCNIIIIFLSPKQFQRSNGDNYQTFPYAWVHINFREKLLFFFERYVYGRTRGKTIRKGKRFIAQPNDINLIIVETFSGKVWKENIVILWIHIKMKLFKGKINLILILRAFLWVFVAAGNIKDMQTLQTIKIVLSFHHSKVNLIFFRSIDFFTVLFFFYFVNFRPTQISQYKFSIQPFRMTSFCFFGLKCQ